MKSATSDRPAIGARVRLRGNTGIPGLVGRTDTVAGHHADGTAIVVRLDFKELAPITCDPCNVEMAR
jgi:hypothetical protein